MPKNTELFRAICVKGRSNIGIARSMGISGESFNGYLYGRTLVPVRKRNAMELAMSATIDWVAYEVEFHDLTASDQPEVGAKQPEPPTNTPPPPMSTNEARKELGMPSGGFWANIWGDTEGEFDAI